MMDNRDGLIGATDVLALGVDARRQAAGVIFKTLASCQLCRILGADRGSYRTAFVAGALAYGVAPHVAQSIYGRRSTSAIDGRTTRSAGYAISQVKRVLFGDVFGWGETISGFRKVNHSCHAKVGAAFASSPQRARSLVTARSRGSA